MAYFRAFCVFGGKLIEGMGNKCLVRDLWLFTAKCDGLRMNRSIDRSSENRSFVSVYACL